MDNATRAIRSWRTFFGFNQWANVEMIDACDQLDADVLEKELPGTQGSIRSTLWHLVELEHRYPASAARHVRCSRVPT